MGNRVTVWIAEHYNMGNWAGLEPYLENSIEASLKIAEDNLPAYLCKLENDGYSYDFCPLGISGVFTDNAPPNRDIERLCALWNRRHGDQIEVRMSTLEYFFERVKEIEPNLPVIRGDWTDWWADGIASTPASVKLFREAQRTYLTARSLDSSGRLIPSDMARKTEYDLNLFAEHTWGYYTSVSDPWNSFVSELDAKKAYYATEAHILANQCMNRVLSAHGKSRKQRSFCTSFGAVNPSDAVLTVPVSFRIMYPGHFPEVDCLIDDQGFRYPVQRCNDRLISILTIGAHEEMALQAISDHEEKSLPLLLSIKDSVYESDIFCLKIDTAKGGIISIYDKQSSRELISENAENSAFRPVYEVTHTKNGDYCGIRSSMGLSRHCADSVQFPAALEKITCIENGTLRSVIVLTYHMEGAENVFLELTLYRGIRQIHVRFALNKESVRDPENLYLSLPFSGKDDTLWIDKTGCILRPSLDQLSNACMSFFSLQNGTVFQNAGHYTSVYCADTPLIRLGSLAETEAAEAHAKPEDNRKPVYAWIMNNFWETNFKASLAGFYEFRYVLRSGDVENPQIAFDEMRREASLPVCFLRDEKADL